MLAAMVLFQVPAHSVQSDIEIPQGLIVAAVLRGGKAIIPHGDDELEVGDEVILFVRRSEIATANLLFPGSESD